VVGLKWIVLAIDMILVGSTRDSGIELDVDLSLTAVSIAVYRPHPPWLITKLIINDEIIRGTFSCYSCSCEGKLEKERA
jgi:hypothetical protein